MTDPETLRSLAEGLRSLADLVIGTPSLSRHSLLSVSQTADTLGRDASTVRRWINRPERSLPAYRPPGGGETMILWGDVLDWLEPLKSEAVERQADETLLRLAGNR